MISAVKGTEDLLFPETERWRRLEDAARRVYGLYGFTEIRTPILEHTELFARGIGEETDIVTKEMYTFHDRKGRLLTMRPENTAGVVRAFVEHRLQDSPLHHRFFYIGPQFRYERPQKGRMRQFHQIGAEVLGEESPFCDAEVISALLDLLKEAGVEGAKVHVNSVGCPACRPAFVGALKDALAPRAGELCGDCNRRLEANPLRVLDCKIPSCQPVLDSAPALKDRLCDACASHHKGLLEALRTLFVPFDERPRLVRGLDYYIRTVFEVTSKALGSQDALLGGGRYDGLVAELGGPPLPGFGYAIGIERLLMAMPPLPGGRLSWVYVAWAGEGTHTNALRLAQGLRAASVPVVVEHRPRAFGAALKRADRMGLRWAVLVGEDELKSGLYPLKNLESGEQEVLDAGQILLRVRGGNEH